VALLITDNHKRRKAKILAALDHFGDALNRNDLILQIIRADLNGAPHCQRLA
jgi:hypothetical protein